MQMFTIILAFDHVKKLLSFFIFHCGSLAASRLSKITTADKLKEVVCLFLMLVLWSTLAEAGIVACYDSTMYLVPTDEKGEQHMSAMVDWVLFWSFCICGRVMHIVCPWKEGELPVDLDPKAEKKPPAQSATGLRHSLRILNQKPAPPLVTPFRNLGWSQKSVRPLYPSYQCICGTP